MTPTPRYKRPRPCCARPTPAFFVDPQTAALAVSTPTRIMKARIPPGPVEYEGTTWCPQCKVARHTFRHVASRRLQVVVVPPNAVRT